MNPTLLLEDAEKVKVNPQLYENSPLVGSSIEERVQEDPAGFYNTKPPNLAILSEKPEHRMVIMLKLKGYSNKEIALSLGYTQSWVSQILRQPWAKDALLAEIRRMGRDELTELIRLEAVNSFQKVVEIRDSTDDDNIALKASVEVLDRYLGKATQKVETKSESLVITGELADIEKKLAAIEEETNRLLSTSNA